MGDLAQQILDLSKAYADDVNNMTIAYGDNTDAIDQQVADLLQQRKDITQQYVKDVATRSAQFVADIKAIFDAQPEPAPVKHGKAK